MNAYLTQPIRAKFGVTWQEEYLMGMVANTEKVSVTNILAKANEVMTLATTHKYLTQLIDKKMLTHKVEKDKRVKFVTLTSKGVKFLNTISEGVSNDDK
jgi:predicted transcriptional regulator